LFGAEKVNGRSRVSSNTSTKQEENPNWVFYQRDSTVYPSQPEHRETDNTLSKGEGKGCVGAIALIVLWVGVSNTWGWIQSYGDREEKSKIIAKEGTLVGHDGKIKYKEFHDAYERNSGLEKLGSPDNYLENNRSLSSSGDCSTHSGLHCFARIQRFSGGSEVKGVILQALNSSKAYSVGGDFLETFKILNSRSGIAIYPTSDREENKQWWKQSFSSGDEKPGCTVIFKIENQIFYVDKAIGCHYFHNEGGEKGKLGFPTNTPKSIPSSSLFGTSDIQYFQNGCIIYDSKKSIPTSTIMPLAKCIQ
jgi:hypothetical protein